jgi:xanthine dehydrogenase small subunit
MQFIVNNDIIQTTQSPGMPLLTFLRQHLGLMGTKVGCREGDCGACTILIGSEDINGEIHYSTAVSCLMPLANCAAKHIVTIEGINLENLNHIQSALLMEGASQCGFCSPGIVISLVGYLLDKRNRGFHEMSKTLDGNICRCTGYKSIQRAVDRIQHLENNGHFPKTTKDLVSSGFLPDYFLSIPEKLSSLSYEKRLPEHLPNSESLFVGGGTDLMLQEAKQLMTGDIHFLSSGIYNEGISVDNEICRLGAGTTIEAIYTSPLLNKIFPSFTRVLRLFASTPIRNMATVAGNIINASPIGDLSIILLVLDAALVISKNNETRVHKLDQFYVGYKKLKLRPTEYIIEVRFKIPSPTSRFTFEKVSKRKILDIASVNSACLLSIDTSGITNCRLSAGGVAAVPLFLPKTSEAIRGNIKDPDTLKTILNIAQEEISPICDIRGSKVYKRLLLRQFILAHLQSVIHEDLLEEILIRT